MTQKIYHSGLDKIVEVYTVRSPADGKQIRYDNEDVIEGKVCYSSLMLKYPHIVDFDLEDAFSQLLE